MRPTTGCNLPLLLLLAAAAPAPAQRVLLTNDDGWATAQIRSQYASLKDANYDVRVVLSAPANDRSGTGSTSVPLALPLLLRPCEFNSCPLGSPGIGSNSSDDHLNYFNSFPVDAARYGLQTLAPKFFNSTPDLLVSGPNIGDNAGLDVFLSGTVGAAAEGEKQGVPSIAFSGVTNEKVSYTTLEPNATSPGARAANVYAALTTRVVQALFAGARRGGPGARLVPTNTIINVNYPALDFSPSSPSSCSNPSDVLFVFARLFPATILDRDIAICDNKNKLPPGDLVVAGPGCHASVVVLDARSKLQARARAQTQVYRALGALGWTCWREGEVQGGGGRKAST